MSGSQVKKYYSMAGMTIAMNDGTGLKYLLTDQLGSVVAMTDSTGTLISQQRYLPFGGVRTDVSSPNSPATDLAFTGQRNLDAQGNVSLGLMDYNARMYDSLLARFIQPDTIIPSMDSPQSWNGYSYVQNNPIGLTDPTGHHCADEDGNGNCPEDPGYEGGSGGNPTPISNSPPADANEGGPDLTSGFNGGNSTITHGNLSVSQSVKQFQQDQEGNYCSAYALSSGLNMLYGTQTTGEDVVTDFRTLDVFFYWPSLS